MGEKERVDAYLETVERIEPDIAMMDRDATLTSIAISLKRIADVLNETNEYGEKGIAAIAGSIYRGLQDRR